MADERLQIDANHGKVVGGVTYTSGEIMMLRLVDATKRLMVATQALSQVTDAVTIYANTLKDGTGTPYVPIVDSDGHLQVDVLSGAELGSTIKAGRKTITTAGTAETLVASSDTLLVGVIIKALKENTGTVHIGTSAVDSTSAKQYELEAGEAISISINDLVKVYVDVSVNGEGVQYIGS